MKIRRYNGSNWVQEYPEVNVGAIAVSNPNNASSSTFLRGDGAWAVPSAGTNNYLTGVSGSGDGTVTFTRQGLGNLTWNAAHSHSEYLLTTGKAADAQLLDGLDSAYYINNTHTSHSASSLAVGWYTIATNTGDRAIARFGLRDRQGGKHQSVVFYAAHHYGTDTSNTITVLHHSSYSGRPFRYIRIKDGSTYDGAALQVYIDESSNNVEVFLLGDNFQSSGWVLKDWIADATDPGDLSNYSSFGERGRIDLDNIVQGGMATTGNIYAGGDTTQYRVLTTNDEGSGNGLDADTLDGSHASTFAPKASPALTGTPTAPTAAANTNTTQIATTAYVQQEITDLIGGAPGALDTLNELAAAINDDSSYASTITTALAGKVAKSGDTMTGTLTIDTGGSSDALVIKGTAPTISFLDDSSGQDDFYLHANSNNFYVLTNRDGDNQVGTGFETPHPLQLEADTNVGYVFGQRIFNELYHPNADKWTTARTITLGGDLSGSVSLDGSANVTLTAAVADDSHNHTIANIDNLQTSLNAKQDSFGDVSTTILPTNGQVLKWNSSASEWQPGDDNNTDTNTTYSAGSGLSLSGTTFSHSDTSSQASVNNTGSTYIQDITLDTYGHITGLASSTITNNITGSTFMTAYDPDIGSVLQYGLYGWQTIDVGSQGQVLTVGGSSYNQWSDNDGGWELIKSGSTTLSSGTTVTNVTLSSAIGDTDVIAFELNTGSVTSYTSQVHIVKIENSSSTSGGILYNQYASSSIIRTGSLRVYRGANTTTLSFSNVYYHSNGSSAETADTVYVGSIWKLKGRVGA